jgi:hypothetical protein
MIPRYIGARCAEELTSFRPRSIKFRRTTYTSILKSNINVLICQATFGSVESSKVCRNDLYRLLTWSTGFSVGLTRFAARAKSGIASVFVSIGRLPPLVCITCLFYD